MKGNPHGYEAGFTIEQHRDELIDRLMAAINELATKDAELAEAKAIALSVTHHDACCEVSPKYRKLAAGNKALLEALKQMESPVTFSEAETVLAIPMSRKTINAYVNFTNRLLSRRGYIFIHKS